MGVEESWGCVTGPYRTLAPSCLSLTQCPATVAPLAQPGHSPHLQDSQYPWSQRVSFAKDIASGMVSRLCRGACGLGDPAPLIIAFSGLPWRSSGLDSVLPLRGARVSSLVGKKRKTKHVLQHSPKLHKEFRNGSHRKL